MSPSYRRATDDQATVEVEVVPVDGSEDRYHVTVGDRVFELSSRLFHRSAFHKDAGEIVVQHEGKEYRLFDAAYRRRAAPGGAGDLRAPMTGKVLRVLVQPGDHVEAGTPLLILESMKMEQQITAPSDGVVARLLCQEGDQVAAGTELVELSPPPA
jgi:biotin carboxyl carrier protein